METRAMQVFLAVADSLNFSRSARQLHMSVSAVSRTIARLEEEVGQPLLERDNRRVRLTRAGREFLDYARDAVARWQQLQRALGTGGELSGEVSLYCSVTATYSLLAPVLAAFRQSHPRVEIMLHTGDQADGVSRVMDGLDDLAISGRPQNLPQRMAFQPLLSTPLQFLVPAADCAVRDMALAGGAQPDWQVLPLIVPERGVTKAMLDAWFADRGVRPRIYAQVAGHEAIVAMVGLGLGIGIAPGLVVEAGGMAASVEPLPVAPPLPSLPVGLCTLVSRLESPMVRALWDVAGQTYAESL
jgi:LysR family positive regulator for ilvC